MEVLGVTEEKQGTASRWYAQYICAVPKQRAKLPKSLRPFVGPHDMIELAGAQITPQRERVYRTAGGAPHLDGSYTVFGEVIGGMGRVVRISKLPTDSQDRPKNEDVYIKSMTVKVVKDRRRDR